MWLQAPLFALLFLTPADASRLGNPPDLMFTRDGNDLVVRLDVTANNSPHVLWTRVLDGADGRVTLYYHIVQNADLYVRSQKKVTVEWRLPGRAAQGTSVRVEQRFEPTTADLKAVLPELQQLAEAGERWKKATGKY